jgi:hypothetical protein
MRYLDRALIAARGHLRRTTRFSNFVGDDDKTLT